MPYEKIDRSKLNLLPLSQREHKMTVENIYRLDSEIPPYENKNLTEVANRIVKAHKRGGQVVWMMGAHVIRRGNSRFIIDLMERDIITHIATNGAGAIHDFELALIGATLEDVERYIKDGKFGNWEETGRYINEAVKRGYRDKIGYGETIGRLIQLGEAGINFPHRNISVFAAAYRLGVPITVHRGIGYDITDQHPSADYAAIGYTSGQDFLIFANTISNLEGGVFLNLGSAVMGPEVYLKSLSMARNIAAQRGKKIRYFTTANFDLIQFDDFREEGKPYEAHYYHRPKKTILVRTVKDGGESFHIQGDFDRTVPNLYLQVVKR
ncbi:hypothetical protein FJZ31_19985 [Candidatus Poribacteria bacterium]|nr:hypothetical protein [Candidatus Poribacteria bacterium]